MVPTMEYIYDELWIFCIMPFVSILLTLGRPIFMNFTMYLCYSFTTWQWIPIWLCHGLCSRFISESKPFVYKAALFKLRTVSASWKTFLSLEVFSKLLEEGTWGCEEIQGSFFSCFVSFLNKFLKTYPVIPSPRVHYPTYMPKSIN